MGDRRGRTRKFTGTDINNTVAVITVFASTTVKSRRNLRTVFIVRIVAVPGIHRAAFGGYRRVDPDVGGIRHNTFTVKESRLGKIGVEVDDVVIPDVNGIGGFPNVGTGNIRSGIGIINRDNRIVNGKRSVGSVRTSRRRADSPAVRISRIVERRRRIERDGTAHKLKISV